MYLNIKLDVIGNDYTKIRLINKNQQLGLKEWIQTNRLCKCTLRKTGFCYLLFFVLTQKIDFSEIAAYYIPENH
jgi:hypothetical protein